jgi:hypothetical protein
MNNYCTECGDPLSGRYCSACGHAARPDGYPQAPPAAAAVDSPCLEETAPQTSITAPPADQPERRLKAPNRRVRRILAASAAGVVVAAAAGTTIALTHPFGGQATATAATKPAAPRMTADAAKPASSSVSHAHLTADWAALPHPALSCPPEAPIEAAQTDYADVNGDGEPDALVTMDCKISAGHNTNIVEVYDGTSSNQNPRRLGTLLNQNENLTIDNLNVSGGAITLHERNWDSTKGYTLYKETFTWDGHGFSTDARTTTGPDNPSSGDSDSTTSSSVFDHASNCTLDPDGTHLDATVYIENTTAEPLDVIGTVTFTAADGTKLGQGGFSAAALSGGKDINAHVNTGDPGDPHASQIDHPASSATGMTCSITNTHTRSPK